MSTQNPTETVECDECGTEFKREQRYTCQPEKCTDCYEQEQIDTLRDSLDPEHDSVFTRADALDRLKNEYNQMPIVDRDGGLIQALLVERHPEGGGAYVEKLEKIVECPECRYERASYSFRSHAGHHPVRSWNCPSCGFHEHYGS